MRDSLFVGLFALFLTNTHAADINDLTYDATGDTVIITDCAKDAAGDLVIPKIIEGKPVTSIELRSFINCRGLTSITIPDSVITIEGYAFAGCYGLTNITIPDNVTSIGDSVFGGCINLTSITIPESITNIGKRAFVRCRSLISIIIPDNVTIIDDETFYGCTDLKRVIIGSNVKRIGVQAFYDCDTLRSVTIGSKVTTIGKEAFYDCDDLTSLMIPDSVINIGDSAFDECDDLLWIKIGRSVSTIGANAFERCKELTSITIPENVTRIGNNAFRSCTKLKSITFESNDPPTIGIGSLGSTNKILYVPKNTTGYDVWANSKGYIIKSINPEFEYVDCSIIKLKDNENIRLSFSGESEKEYYIQRSCDLERWEILEGNIQPDEPIVLSSTIIFDEQQQKKALVPTEDIGNDWIQLNYDDSNWLDVESVSGDGTLLRGGVGFARTGTRIDPFDPYIALDLEEQMYRINTSVYIRIPFTIDDLSEIDSLILAARTDDGFVAWINGDKVQSFYAPNEPQWNSEATASNSDSIAMTLKEFSLDDHIDKLRVGENIIAIQALNKGKSGSDFLFSCNLLVKRIIKSVNSDFSIDLPLVISSNNHQLTSQFYRVISQ